MAFGGCLRGQLTVAESFQIHVLALGFVLSLRQTFRVFQVGCWIITSGSL